MFSGDRADGGGAAVPEFFRAVNEQIRELPWPEASDYDLVCECGDAGCIRMLQMRPEEYQALRSDRTHFAVIPGHEGAGRHEVVIRGDRFLIVRSISRFS